MNASAALQAKQSQTITVRSIRPDFHGIQTKYWIGNNPIATFIISVMSFQFPEGEASFIRSVDHFKGEVEDPDLRRAIKAFIGQEHLHGKVHNELNEYIAKQIPEAEVFCKEISASIQERSDKLLKNGKALTMLAETVAFEHMTAIMAANLLKRSVLLKQIEAPEIRALLIWHAIEEIEHKSVAYDVFKAAGGTYWQRVRGMLRATTIMSWGTISYTWRMMRQDKDLNFRQILNSAIMSLDLASRFFLVIVGKYLQFFSPNFHPTQNDEHELLKFWSGKLAKETPVRIAGQVEYASPATQVI